MSRFLGAQSQGAAIQICNLVSMGVQNLLAPRLLGTEQYGLAAALISVPFFFQGLAEPILTSMIIKLQSSATADGIARTRIILRDAFIWLATGGCASGWYSYHLVKAAGGHAGLSAALCLLLVAVLSVSTYMMALAYARQYHALIIKAYLVSNLFLPLGLILCRDQGAASLLAAISISYTAVIAIFLNDSKLRAAAAEPLLSTAKSQIRHNSYTDYSAAAASRLVGVMLFTATVMLAGLYMSPVDLAQYKLTLSLIAATAYVIPLSPPVLLASLASNPEEKSKAYWLLHGSFLLALIAAVILWWQWQTVATLVFVDRPSFTDKFAPLFLAAPFYALSGALSAYSLALGKRKILAWSGALATISILTFSLAKMPVVAFFSGTLLFIIPISIWTLRRERAI